MKLIINSIAVVILLCSNTVWAAGGGSTYPHDAAPVNLDNKASMQRGAKLYVNYCQGCHSLQFQRYNRLAKDLELDEKQVMENLVFTTGTKIGDTMQTAMPAEAAKGWFGAEVPDLSLIARARGADYLFNYLRGFYADSERPYGMNNSVFPLVGMPHVLVDLQGVQVAERDSEGNITGFDLVKEGAMTPKQYKSAIADLVNFLVYVAEPYQQERKRLGFWVILYLLLATVVFYFLKKEYWRDVH